MIAANSNTFSTGQAGRPSYPLLYSFHSLFFALWRHRYKLALCSGISIPDEHLREEQEMADAILVLAGMGALGYGVWAYFTGYIGFDPQYGHVWRSDDHSTGRTPGSTMGYHNFSAQGPLAKGVGVVLALFGLLLLGVVGLDAMGIEQAASIKSSLGNVVSWYVSRD